MEPRTDPAAGTSGGIAAAAWTASAAHVPQDALVWCENLVKVYQDVGVEVVALQGLDLLVRAGELMAVVGPSGSGKSTLLSILSALDSPTAGAVVVGGYDLTSMRARERVEFRRHVVGFVWQQTGRNLVPYLTAAENVRLPMHLAGVRGREQHDRAARLLSLVGAAGTDATPAHALSRQQQQLTAVAVALANQPRVLLADEPTGDLDLQEGAQLLAVLRTVRDELGVPVVVVTHDVQVAESVDRTVGILDGKTSREVRWTRDGSGSGELVREEHVLLDRVGRLQLPRAYVDRLQLRDRVRVSIEDDHVAVRPEARPGAGPQEEAGSPPDEDGPRNEESR